MVIMACSIEKILGDAKQLVNRLREHDSIADTLITQTQSLHRRVDAMKQVRQNEHCYTANPFTEFTHHFRADF